MDEPLDDYEALSPDACEILLGEMVVGAESVPPAQRTKRIREGLIGRAEEVIVARLGEWFKERQRLNDALVAHRLASVEQTFRRTERMRESAIAQARMLGRRESYVRGLETALRNLRAAQDRKRDDDRPIHSGVSPGVPA